MAQYRKKPVVIEAWPIADLLRTSMSEWPVPVRAAGIAWLIRPCINHLQIETLEGLVVGREEDLLIMGVKGEFYPCKPDIFLATYDPA